jgi:hypothetical protein
VHDLAVLDIYPAHWCSRSCHFTAAVALDCN